MRRKSRTASLVAILCFFIFGAVLLTWGLLALTGKSSAQNVQLANPEHRKMLCGPESLFKALGRLGIVCDSADELAEKCMITRKGITLREIERVANTRLEVKSRVKILDWDCLKSLNGTAVLFVRDNHYVAADPREKQPSGRAMGDYIRIYDEAQPATWMTRRELEKVWKGEALTIEKMRPSLHKAVGPLIEWDASFVDAGMVKPNSVVRYSFSFCNVGDGDLRIKDVKKSCGCTTYTITSSILAPGQRGMVEAESGLRGKEGYIEITMALRTNSSTTPFSVLRMAAGVPKTRALSAESISFGDLPQGGKMTREFYSGNPGFGALGIRDAHFLQDTGNNLAGRLTSSMNYCLLGSDFHRVANLFGIKVKPEDYRIRLELEADENCPVGPIWGQAIVVLEANDRVSTHTVRITGAVVSDVYSIPSVALIALNGDGYGSATIRLQNHTKRGFQVAEAWADKGTPVGIERVDGPQGANTEFILSASMPAVVAGATPVESAVFLKLDSGKVVRAPIVICKPQRP